MEAIKKFPDIAVLFGVLAIATSLVLVLDAPRVLNYVFAVFWFITGLLGLYAGKKSCACK